MIVDSRNVQSVCDMDKKREAYIKTDNDIRNKKIVRYINPKLYPWIASFLTAFVYLVTLSCMGILGNGVFILETGDLKTQYIPFIMQMGEVIKGKHSLWYSWNMGIGSGSIGSYAFYTFSPFNVIYWLLGYKRIHIASALVIVLKASASAATFQIFISRFLKRNYYETVIFSFMYALNGYAVAYYDAINFMDSLLVFPIIMLGIHVLFTDGKQKILVLSYSYLFITSLYMGYIIGLSSFVLFLIYFSYRSIYLDKIYKVTIIQKYVLSVLGALGITAVIWLPVAFNMIELSNSDSIYKRVIHSNLMMIFNNAFLGQFQSIDGFVPYFYCGLLAIISIPAFFSNKHIMKRKRIYGFVCIALFVLIMRIDFMNNLMHGFDIPNAIGFRYSFVLSFLMLLIMAKQFPYIVGNKGLSVWYVISLIIVYTIVFCINKYIFFTMLKEEYNSNSGLVYLLNVACMLLIFACTKLYKYKKWDTITKRTFFTFVIAVEIICNIVIVQNRIGHNETTILDEIITASEDNTIRLIKKDFDDNIRTIYQDKYIMNVALEHDLSSLYFFSSMINNRLINALTKLGFEYRANVISGAGWTPITASILGIDYIVDGDSLVSDDPEIQVLLDVNEKVHQKLYKNNQTLPLLFAVNKDILDYKFEGTVFDNHDKLLSAMTGKEVKCYKDIGMRITSEAAEIIEDDGRVKITNLNYPDSEALVMYTSDTVTYSNVYANLYNEYIVYKGDVRSKAPTIISSLNYEDDMYNTVPIRIYPNQIIRSGEPDEKQRSSFVMKLPADMETVEYEKGYFVEYDEAVFDNVYRELKSNNLDIDVFKDGFVSGSIYCDKDCVLFSSIPYEKGWEAFVDSKKVDVIPIVEDAFVGLELGKGHHNIVLKYVAPGKYVGMCITFLTIVIYGYYYGKSKLIRNILHKI